MPGGVDLRHPPYVGDTLCKQRERGAMVVVPRTEERMQLALDTHQSMGHFGVQRVMDRLQMNYWWRGMGDTVVATIQVCLALRPSEGWLQRVWPGVTAVADPGTWISVGCGLRWAIGENRRGSHLCPRLHRALHQVGGADPPPFQVLQGRCSRIAGRNSEPVWSSSRSPHGVGE